MSAKIRLVSGVEATINEYQWACEDAVIEGLLQLMLDPSDPSGADPNPDATAAAAAVETLGGELISFDKTEYVEGEIY